MYKFSNLSQLQSKYYNNSTVQSHYYWRKNHFLPFLNQSSRVEKSEKNRKKEGKHCSFIVCLLFIYSLFKNNLPTPALMTCTTWNDNCNHFSNQQQYNFQQQVFTTTLLLQAVRQGSKEEFSQSSKNLQVLSTMFARWCWMLSVKNPQLCQKPLASSNNHGARSAGVLCCI